MEISQYTWHWQTGLFQETRASPHCITSYCAVSEMRKYDGGGEDLCTDNTQDMISAIGHKTEGECCVYSFIHDCTEEVCKI